MISDVHQQRCPLYKLFTFFFSPLVCVVPFPLLLLSLVDNRTQSRADLSFRCWPSHIYTYVYTNTKKQRVRRIKKEQVLFDFII